MNNTTKPSIQILYSNEEPKETLLHILLFFHYLIAFPIIFFCWLIIIKFLKKRGHLSTSEAEIMLEEMKSIPIQQPIFYKPK